MTRTKIAKLYLVALGSLCIASSCDMACQDPVGTIQGMVESMMSVLGDKCQVSAKKAVIEEVVEKRFIPSVDIDLITKQVLGRRYWEESSEGDKKSLKALLEQLLAKQYAEAFSCEHIGKEMRFFPVRGEVKKYSRVESSIALDEKTLTLVKYNVRCNEGQWLIYDIIVDGLSLGQTYRSQFNRVLQQGGIKALINYLDQKLNKVVDEVSS